MSNKAPAVWFHLDLDAFFASVEQADNPEYKGKALVVGALPGHRGVVATCSYEARKFGLHSAMPISQAFRKCPQAIYIRPRFERYQEISKQIMNLLASYSPEFLQVSIDEAYLNMTGTEKLWGKPIDLAKKIKKQIFETFHLTASIGIASNRYCAKMASDYKKPDGITCIEAGKEEEFVASLPLAKLWGLGKKTLSHLNSLGFKDVASLKKLSEASLEKILGSSGGMFLSKAVRGLDPGIFKIDAVKNPSISKELTFQKDLDDPELLDTYLQELAQAVFFRCKEEAYYSSVLSVRLRYSDFTTKEFQKKKNGIYRSVSEVLSYARKLFFENWTDTAPLRLLGLGLSGLSHQAPSQLNLFDSEESYDKEARLEDTILELKKRFPEIPLRKANFLKP